MVGEAPGEEEAKYGKPFIGGAGGWLRNLSRSAGIQLDETSLVNSISCRPPDNVYPNDPKARYISREDGARAIAHCAKEHLWPAIQDANKHKIFAIGGQALTALTGKIGINIWRGSPLPLTGGTSPRVMPTIHPAALMRQAKLTSVVVSDLRKGLTLPPENYNLTPTLQDVERFRSKAFAFDFEWDSMGNISLCGLSDRFYMALVVPFSGAYIPLLREIFERADVLIGHNIIGADLTYIDKMGWRLKARIEDTMLKQHLCQPDYKHDLAFVASVFTNKVFWKGKGWEEEDDDGEITPAGQQWRTWDKAYALPRSLGGYGGCTSATEAFALYNARDTDAEFQINTPLDNLLSKYELDHVYKHVSVPVAYICRDIGERGLRLDNSRLGSIRADIDKTILALEAKLPTGLKPFEKEVNCNLPAPPGTYKPKRKVCKGSRSDRHAPVPMTFSATEAQTCPVCSRQLSPGKMAQAKIIKSTRQQRVVPYNSPQSVQAYVEALKLQEVRDSKTGNRTTGKRARKIWAKEHPEFTVLGALKEQVTLRNNFAKTSLRDQARMYFSLKVHGTSEGRLSSSGKRSGIDLNIQNQPPKFRVIYVPDKPDWAFLNLDIVQGENWLTTWIAKDWARWERLQDPAYDEHSELASQIFGKPIDKARAKNSYWSTLHPDWLESACEAEALYYDSLRQIGKKINHGRNYGMGVRKQKEELAAQGYDHYTEADVRDFIEIWKKLNARTAEWQNETIATATQQGFLRNAFGRVRWFTTRSIATECLAFLPASTLADMVLRMMIAHYPNDERIEPSIQANGLGVFHPIVDEWIMSIQVHDSLVLQGPDASWREQASRSKAIMEQPFRELEGFKFRVETKYGTDNWGAVKTVEV